MALPGLWRRRRGGSLTIRTLPEDTQSLSYPVIKPTVAFLSISQTWPPWYFSTWYLGRITESQGLEGTSVGHQAQPHCRSRVTYSRLHRTLSRQVLNISREGDSTTSLGSVFQCSVTLRGKKFFLMFRRNFPCFILCPLPLVLSLGITEKSLAPSSWHPSLRYL